MSHRTFPASLCSPSTTPLYHVSTGYPCKSRPPTIYSTFSQHHTHLRSLEMVPLLLQRVSPPRAQHAGDLLDGSHLGVGVLFFSFTGGASSYSLLLLRLLQSRHSPIGGGAVTCEWERSIKKRIYRGLNALYVDSQTLYVGLPGEGKYGSYLALSHICNQTNVL